MNFRSKPTYFSFMYVQYFRFHLLQDLNTYFRVTIETEFGDLHCDITSYSSICSANRYSESLLFHSWITSLQMVWKKKIHTKRMTQLFGFMHPHRRQGRSHRFRLVQFHHSNHRGSELVDGNLCLSHCFFLSPHNSVFHINKYTFEHTNTHKCTFESSKNNHVFSIHETFNSITLHLEQYYSFNMFFSPIFLIERINGLYSADKFQH